MTGSRPKPDLKTERSSDSSARKLENKIKDKDNRTGNYILDADFVVSPKNTLDNQAETVKAKVWPMVQEESFPEEKKEQPVQSEQVVAMHSKILDQFHDKKYKSEYLFL